MEKENRKLLIEGGKSFGICLAETEIGAFDLYLEELLKWNRKINLTAIRTEKGIVQKHFLDSLCVYPFIPHISTLLDIGSGAGFPGIPLKIVQPALEVTLIDAIRKKVDFQRHIIRKLGLKGIEAIHSRVQEKAVLQSQEGRFAIVISRAFSDLQTLLVLSVPLLKKGGIVVAMKGRVNREEIRLLSEKEGTPYRLRKIIPLVLPYRSPKRSILLFEKE
jgi:16S rRNA (guanine527-N7)-methyltransferase